MTLNTDRPKLAIIATHPIQYQAPLWKKLAQSSLLKLKVFYANNHGSVESYDPLYGKSFTWDVPLLEGYEYEFLRSIKIPGLPGPTACYFPLGLQRRLIDGSYDAILIHGYMNGAAWAGYLAARKLEIPVFIRGDSHLIKRNLDSIRAKFKKFILGRFLRHINGCLAIGEWNRQYWQYYGMPEVNIHTTLFSVDNDRFIASTKNNKDKVKGLRDSWNAKTGETVFIFSGNILHHKGIDILINAFLLLQKKRKDIHLVIIGEGSEKERLQLLAANNIQIHWTGFINQSDMPAYLNAADVFVLPSRYEPWGLVVNEALASGLPCLVSSVVGAGPDMVATAKTGLVFSEGNIDDLAIKMQKACDLKIRTLWKANIPLILNKASYDQNVHTIEHCLNNTLTKHGTNNI